MKTSNYSIDDINKAIRNNLFNRIANIQLQPIEQPIIDNGKVLFIHPATNKQQNDFNPFAPRDNGQTTINFL